MSGVSDKKSVVSGGEDSSSSYYIYISNAVVHTSRFDYNKVNIGDDAYCAIFRYKDKDYFCYCGPSVSGR